MDLEEGFKMKMEMDMYGSRSAVAFDLLLVALLLLAIAHSFIKA